MPAFLFTDIEGSTRLWEEHSQVMSAAISSHNELIENAAEAHHGQIVKSTGDGFLILFEQGNPLECAIAMQLAFQEQTWPDEIGELRIRIGIHTGTFERRLGDIYGADVNRTARVMDAAWGGQILITDDAKIEYKLPENAHLVDLGSHLLKNINDPQPLFGLVAPNLQQEFPPPRTISAQPNNLPILPTAFVGREDEIKAIGDLLRNNTCRLITLHGPGGIGKTRLSIQTGISFLKHYPYGVYFVALAPLNDSNDIWPAIASSINLPLYNDKSPSEQVLNYLKEKDMLLVLDNFEHLQDGATIVNDLLEAAPRLQILVTSRSRMQLAKECIFEVEGLRFPEAAEAEIFENFEAVQLFTMHAHRADPSFQLDSSDRQSVVEICKLMQGMPLGIELAAHWIRVISPQEIVNELRQDIDLLQTEMVDVPERHRSMRAMFDYSWKLLDEKEKQVLKYLSIFRDGCTLSAAKAVAGASLMVISGLVDKSLVKKNSLGRYEMHELIRQLAEEKLRADQDDFSQLLDKHADHYLSKLAASEEDLKGKAQIKALDDLEADFENLRFAWLNAIQNNLPGLVENALESYFWMLTYRNHHAAGQELFERARQKWNDPPTHPALFHQLRIHFPKPENESEAIYQQAVDSARSRGEKHELAVSLNLLGRYVGHILQDEERGLVFLNEARELFEQLGDDFYLGHVLDDISFTYLYMDLKARIKYAEKSLALREKTGDLFGLAGVLGNLVVSYFWDGQIDKFEENSRRALEAAHQTKDVRNIAWQKIYLAELRLFQGKFEQAEREITEAERICQDIYDTDMMIQVKINKATIIALTHQQYQQAKQILQSTLPIDAEFSMHTPGAMMAYGIAAVGTGDIEMVMELAKFPFHAMTFVDTGVFGLSWFSPIIIFSLNYQKKYQQAAECLGFTYERGKISRGMVERWPLIKQIEAELKDTLGVQAFQQAYDKGKKMKFNEFREYVM
ncbi:MAG: adenylate/guanylate cyclase domain-containing protein [Anaerolineales bacterium]|jgi:predicted ATPase/class 3 adenylate cyclase